MGVSANLFVKQRGSTTALKQPKEIGFYSRTKDEEYLISDDTNLNYYYLPDAELDRKLDLSSGFQKFKDYYKDFEDRCSLRGLLETIESSERHKGKKINADIITFRGIARKLISCAFDSPSFNTVDLRIVSFNGQLFIKEVPEAVNAAKASSATEAGRNINQDLNVFTGYKFETMATLSNPLQYTPREVIEKRTKRIVSHGDEYISVVRTGVGNCKLILGAEVDCIFDFKENGRDNLKHYAELKCTQQVTNISDTHKFERKLFRTWLQCFLVGIPRIIYGFKDDHYVLKTVEEFSTEEVPVLLKNNNPQVGSACLEAIKWYGLLTEWLLKMIPRDEDPHSQIRAFKLVFENNHLRLSEIEESDEEYSGLIDGEHILTNEFKEWRKSLK
ncbi:CEI_1a_G0017630.mRNA.1.CDS.1 [Saccharomyces cerevisiae]|nr:EM14S01-3B_G0030680.mRNA.1.CDS.1 [Saccharomyces cerevisiae]CAI4448015.1 AMH_1a_G0017690.mRNA.1.CDS.1 [Saccharomyces cerevisiae]CAI4454518.1 CEI_1a_G0017630.mRNA.1.CDS.1 [Saccharomyces cerevisiae]CAI6649645.1 AMH_1a_G0017690.mRNA.1.CDS.1 [Saccharomyces cerevisiae]CAI7281120.1 CEI_1a_G0017630.mRNA.1.CDS.1 [Saccharomyces cerevisiae]